ncbi:MAG: caspase family protein, partial [Nitrososphaera sp.]
MPTGVALTIGLNSVDPKHYSGWSGELNACEA